MSKLLLPLTLVSTFAFMMLMNSGCKSFVMQDLMP